jgi:hypothetical protein
MNVVVLPLAAPLAVTCQDWPPSFGLQSQMSGSSPELFAVPGSRPETVGLVKVIRSPACAPVSVPIRWEVPSQRNGFSENTTDMPGAGG